MGTNLIYGHVITLAEACVLNEKYGFEFIIEDVEIASVIHC